MCLEINLGAIVSRSVLLVSYGGNSGGASKATRNIFDCFRDMGMNCKLLVVNGNSAELGIRTVNGTRRLLINFYAKLDFKICKFLLPSTKEWQTSGLIGIIKSKAINKLDYDFVNLHFIAHGTMSLRQIRKIKKPILWTLHDEWLLHPISHYPESGFENRNNRRMEFTNWISRVLQRYIVHLKKRIIMRNNVYFICPSTEIMEKFLGLYPSKKAFTFFIENPVRLEVFAPLSGDAVIPRQGNQSVRKYILYLGGDRDLRKGYDLLFEAIKNMESQFDVLAPGSSRNFTTGRKGQIRFVGTSKINNDSLLSYLYQHATFTVVPSRYEAGGPQVATESISCGTPVIGFSVGGMKQFLFENGLGIVVRSFDSFELSNAMERLLWMDPSPIDEFCRYFAVNNFSFYQVQKSYQKLFAEIES